MRPGRSLRPAVAQPRRVPAWVSACLLGALVGISAARGAAAQADSVRFHAEAGIAASASNEQFYEDNSTDTTFLGRRLHSTPESWLGGVAAFALDGTAGAGRWQYALHPEATLGSVVTRAGSTGALRFRPDERWLVALEPRAEWSHDRSFGIDRHEAVAGSQLRARYRSDDETSALDLRLGGEWLATPGSSDPYLLAHRNGRAGIAWSHDALFGWAWSTRYDATLRTFPDSTLRDHVEHEGAFELRRDFEGGHSATLDLEATRRSAVYAVASSRDRFTELRGALESDVRCGERLTLQAQLTGELHRFDAPDSTIDFDYAVTRASVRLRRELAGGWSLALGPRFEWVAAPWNAAERYGEAAGVASLEVLGRSAWWQLEPAAGWRGYALSESGSSTDPAALHSSFAFAELQCLGEQALPAHLRVRITFDGRYERHEDPSQDSRSLYFSCDLRRLF